MFFSLAEENNPDTMHVYIIFKVKTIIYNDVVCDLSKNQDINRFVWIPNNSFEVSLVFISSGVSKGVYDASWDETQSKTRFFDIILDF